jgi:lysophospholipase L1-like esterase
VIAEHIGTWFDVYSEYAMFTQALESWAAAHNAAYIDFWGMGRRSHEYWDDLGYFADQIHLTTAGYAAAAQPLLDLITQ